MPRFSPRNPLVTSPISSFSVIPHFLWGRNITLPPDTQRPPRPNSSLFQPLLRMLGILVHGEQAMPPYSLLALCTAATPIQSSQFSWNVIFPRTHPVTSLPLPQAVLGALLLYFLSIYHFLELSVPSFSPIEPSWKMQLCSLCLFNSTLGHSPGTQQARNY